MDPVRIYGRLKEVAAELAALVNRHRPPREKPVQPREILIKVDDDGTGNAVCSLLRRDGYHCVAVGAGTGAAREDLYPRRRDELWFAVAARAREGGVYVGDLDRATLRRLRQQLLAPAWELDARGRRKVEPKDKTREKIKRSPDDADAFNLAYLEGMALPAPEYVDVPPPVAPAVPPHERLRPREGWEATRRRIYGR